MFTLNVTVLFKQLMIKYWDVQRILYLYSGNLGYDHV